MLANKTALNGKYLSLCCLALAVWLLMQSPAIALVIYVDANAGGANDGSSWTDAYNLLQDALDDADSGDEIWVAQGTYYPTTEVGGTGERFRTFQMKNGVAIYGGFPDANNPGWADRDPNLHETILSGDIGTPSDDNDNCYHVFYHQEGIDLDSSAILDGFAITSGNADGEEYPCQWGGGMSNVKSSPTLTNCIFSGNSAYIGSGMDNFNNSSPTLTNCTFIDNSAYYGGGMCNSFHSNTTLTNCTFISNRAEYYIYSVGGGMYNNYSNPTLTNCTFIENSAKYGGGMENGYSALASCTFRGNSAEYGGGMENYWGSNPTLTNCTFSGNSAEYGGGMENYGGSSPTLTSCTFSGNSAEYGGGMENYWRSNPTITNCNFSGNSAEYGGGMCNRFSSPTLTNCTFSGNSVYEGGGIYNIGNSPTLTNCTFSGNSVYEGGGIYNTDSRPKITNCTFSRNSAYDSGGGIFNKNYSVPMVANCILWANTAQSDGPQIYNDKSSGVKVYYSDVQDFFPGIGIIDADPLFVDADGADDIIGTDDDNLHLKSYSPCIDKGDPSGDYSEQTDMDGQQRLAYDRVDMGADEVFPIAGDFEPDGDVDAADLGFFTGLWLEDCTEPGWCNGCDIDMSGKVNFTDFARLTAHWFKGIE